MENLDYLFSGLRNLPHELRKVMRGISDEYQAVEEGGLNLRQVLRHMQDSTARVHLPRLRQIADQQHPYFDDSDGEDEISIHYDPGQSLEEMADSLAEQCEQTADWLQDLSEDDWQRIGTHAILGAHSLQWWADRMLAHLEGHLSYLRGD